MVSARVHPMLATLAESAFDRPGWLFEPKWDGYRAMADCRGRSMQLYSRQGNSFAEQFPGLYSALNVRRLKGVFDGEIVALDDQGRSRFQLLQQHEAVSPGRLVYVVFDMLWQGEKNLQAEPLAERKTRLSKAIKPSGVIQLGEHIEEYGVAFFAPAMQQGLEGIVAKELVSPYLQGRRSRHWQKIKVRQRQEAVIAGYTAPRGSRLGFGSLILGVYEAGILVYIGHTGGGLDQGELRTLRHRLAPLIVPDCPFKKRPKTNEKPTWTRPEVVCEVVFQEWTADGRMRQPIYLGLRDDKPARRVRRERPKENASS